MTLTLRSGDDTNRRPTPSQTAFGAQRRQYLARPAFLLSVLWLSTAIWLWPHGYASGSNEQPPFLGLAQGAAEVFGFLVALMHWKQLLQTLKYTWPIVGYIGFLGLHEIWVSENLNNTLRSIALYFDLFASAALMLYIDGPKRLFRWIIYFAAFFMLINYASVAVPSISRMRSVGAEDANRGLLRGFMAHKNDLSACSLILGLICYFSSGRSGLLKTSVATFIALGLVGLLILGGSVQGIILGILLSGLGAFLMFQARFGQTVTWTFGASFIIAMGFMAIIGGASLNSVLQHFGRDATLTGRTAIWNYFMQIAASAPWKGYGIGQWFDQPSTKAVLDGVGLPSQIHSTHSAYLESYLSFGLPGAALFLALCGLGVFRVITHLSQPNRANIIGIILIVNCLVGGVAAAEKLFLPNIGWFSFTMGLMLLGPGLRAEERPPRKRRTTASASATAEAKPRRKIASVEL